MPQEYEAAGIETDIRELAESLQLWFEQSHDTLNQLRDSFTDEAGEELGDYMTEITSEVERTHKEIRASNERCRLMRPAVALMGGVNSGKTAVIHGILSHESAPLPATFQKAITDVRDCTNCQICFRGMSPGAEADERRPVLTIDVEVPRKINQPALPNEFARCFTPADDSSALERILRFPSDGDDECSVSIENDEIAVGKRSGSDNHYVPLSHVQYSIRQAVLPLEAPPNSLLSEIELIDTPGADPQHTNRHKEWKEHADEKNREIFVESARRIDLLILAVTCDPKAMRVGRQFQDGIWVPWLDRCKRVAQSTSTESMRGRFVVVITHGAKLFAGIDETSQRSNLLKGVGASIFDGLPPYEEMAPAEWPPVIFVESVDTTPTSVDATEAAEIRNMLIEAFDAGRPTALEPKWSPHVKSVHWHAQSLWENPGFHRQTPAARKKIYELVVKRLIAVLDPKDRGIGQLCEHLASSVRTGPLRAQFLADRFADVSRFWSHASEAVASLDADDSRVSLSLLIEDCREILRRHGWTETSLGWLLEFGKQVETLRSEYRYHRQSAVTFSVDAVHRAVVEDALDAVEGMTVEERTKLRRLLGIYFQEDHPWRVASADQSAIMSTRIQAFIRLTHLAHQRMVAFFDDITDSAPRLVSSEHELPEQKVAKLLQERGTQFTLPFELDSLDRLEKRVKDFQAAAMENRQLNSE